MYLVWVSELEGWSDDYYNIVIHCGELPAVKYSVLGQELSEAWRELGHLSQAN